MQKKDNSTLSLKIALRRNALREVATPVVLETHGGYGAVYARCYADVIEGVVIEKDDAKAAFLARQRPTWAVYEADCVTALRAGVGAHLPINFVDIDPYGDPWPVLDAFLESDRAWASTLVIVVNDGLRQKVKASGGWDAHSLWEMVDKYGSNLYEDYLGICREMMANKTAQLGYSLRRWAGYYCGHARQMTHYAAVLERQ